MPATGSVCSQMNGPFVAAPEIDLLFLPPTCLEIDHEPFLHRFFAVTGPHYYKYISFLLLRLKQFDTIFVLP